MEGNIVNVSLTPELEKIVHKKVKSGLYNSASEVVREALRLLDEQDHFRAMKLEALREDIQAGLRSGKSVQLDMEAIKAEARKRYNKRHKK
jgi:antitoxin ParD1/3/4